MRTAVYCRISRDRDAAQTGLGVARQEADCRGRADSLGWAVVDVLTDNDVSAYSGKRRPGYERLLTGLRDGTYDAVIAWAPDRLHRSPIELETFIDVVEQAGASVVTVQAGELDLSTPAGRMTARVVGAVARHESEHKAARIRRKHLELAEAGKNPGGGTRPFGFEDDRVSLRHEEAEVVRELARRVLDGETIRSLARDLNARAISTVTGGAWQTTVLRNMLVSARIAGMRSHRGRVTKAEWPEIISPDEHYRLRALLEAPERRKNRSRRAYLLTGGLAVCGLCGAALVARPREDKRRCYVCATGPGFRGCGKIRVLADPFEEMVCADVLTALEGVGAVGTETPAGPDDEALAALQAIEGRLSDLAGMWAAGEITKREWNVARESLDAQLDNARRAVATETRRSIDLADYRDRWASLDLDQRRTVLDAVLDRVTLGPAVRGRNFFDPDRVSYVWRA